MKKIFSNQLNSKMIRMEEDRTALIVVTSRPRVDLGKNEGENQGNQGIGGQIKLVRSWVVRE